MRSVVHTPRVASRRTHKRQAMSPDILNDDERAREKQQASEKPVTLAHAEFLKTWAVEKA